MRREGQIRYQYKQLKYRHRKAAIESNFKRLPCNCIHNRTRDLADGSRVQYCALRETRNVPEWDRVICDDRDEEDVNFVRHHCDHFQPLKSSEDIKDEFNALIDHAESTGDLGYLALHYQDIAALLWVLAPWDHYCSGVPDMEIGWRRVPPEDHPPIMRPRCAVEPPLESFMPIIKGQKEYKASENLPPAERMTRFLMYALVPLFVLLSKRRHPEWRRLTA